jgi:F-type H+-transporting ATPase subunit b
MLVSAVWSPVNIRAQEGAAHASAAPSAQSSGGEAAQAATEVKGEEKKAKGEFDWVRESGSVKWFAKVTGLSLDHAYWLCVGLNFAVIFVFAAVLLRKNLPGFFKSRTSAIQKGIEEARKMSEEARRRLGEVEGRLARLDADIASMRSDAEKNAQAEEARLMAAGEEERRRIVVSAEQEIAMAANAARRELKAYAAGLAVDLAEKKIRVGKDADEALVRGFTARLGKDGN